MTRTYVECPVSPAAHAEIIAVLVASGYAHVIDDETIYMDGLALVVDAAAAPTVALPAMIARLRENHVTWRDTIDRCAEAADILAAQAVEIERLTNELRIIANADVASWDDPSEFKAWAQNRARAAIAKETQ